MLSDLKGLASRSIVYSSGDLLLRAISFLLLPIYTRVLTPTDYGILAVTGLVAAILALLSSLSLHGFVYPTYFAQTNELTRRRALGTLFVAILLIGFTFTLITDQVGTLLFPLIFPDVSFQPYIRIAIWTTFLASWQLVPLAILKAQERSVTYVLLTVAGSLLHSAIALGLVVYLGQGVWGMLVAAFAAAILMLIPYLVVTLRNITLALERETLNAALIFSLPLVPHALAGWLLQLSDRAILQWYVPLEQLGIYSLAYTLGMLISIVATAMNAAWVPFLFRTDANEGLSASTRLGQLATYYALILCFVALGFHLLAEPILTIMTPASYHGAIALMPWMIAGQLLSGLYFIPVSYLFLRRKTRLVPQITVVAAIVNLFLNLWFIPSFGVIAAAWTTFISYAIMLFLAWRLAFKVYPVVYEYRRLAIIALITILLWLIGHYLSLASLWSLVFAKLGLLLLLPLLLVAFGFLSTGEKRRIGLLFRKKIA
ncbi:lipopolysaccharide biosynthesis protein [Candidatus Viridilinea mediisalina]|uniref:Uncharacterized protein n=1 Tax=Candidatus Viridilinea mediisalina TaxID=2024553 RepID=A0A2A6RMC1_9CHLR|nr:oligosaccharide flippase family protein [Candidatus Viridilinea mediisalina]PDW04028.1 hypothetical protein CJ255_05500 [Candidatus Viridilinea mediisalina]